MSLFKLSTPERRLASEKANQILPIIPNEIYLCILELIAPATDHLTPEQCKTCAHLSGVCRFFANFCLPRVFEFVEFSGPLFDDALTPQHCHDAVYETTRETVLCTQIAAKQPLALALAERVMTCHFTNFRPYRWSQELDDTDKLLYHAGMSHMRNIRELAFFQCFVDAGQWDAIAALPSLETLGFRACRFPRHFEGIGPGERVKVKPSRFWLVSSKHRRPLGAIDIQCLRALAADHFAYFTILDLNPQSLEALALLIDDEFSSGLDLLRRTLDELVWKNLPVLQSLTLRIHAPNLIEFLSTVLESVDLNTPPSLHSLTLQNYGITLEISFIEVQRVLQDKLGPSSSLKYVNIYGRALRLMDGEWVEHVPTDCSPSDKLLCSTGA